MNDTPQTPVHRAFPTYAQLLLASLSQRSELAGMFRSHPVLRIRANRAHRAQSVQAMSLRSESADWREGLSNVAGMANAAQPPDFA